MSGRIFLFVEIGTANLKTTFFFNLVISNVVLGLIDQCFIFVVNPIKICTQLSKNSIRFVDKRETFISSPSMTHSSNMSTCVLHYLFVSIFVVISFAYCCSLFPLCFLLSPFFVFHFFCFVSHIASISFR